MEVLFDYVRAFSYSPLPSGPRVAILTNAGGPAVMASDAVDRAGLELAPLSGATLKALSAALPAAASVDNPVDVLGDATSDLYQEALSVLAADDSVDSLLVLLTPQRMTEPERTARAISFLAREQSKPILASFMGGTAVDRARAMLDGARVPVFNYPERAVGALSALVEYSRYRQETKAEAASQ
jgi:acetyltransferase